MSDKVVCIHKRDFDNLTIGKEYRVNGAWDDSVNGNPDKKVYEVVCDKGFYYPFPQELFISKAEYDARSKETKFLTDLQLVDQFCEKCMQHISPQIFREINHRGLYDIINYLPKTTVEAKAVARARMAKLNKYFGDPEIDAIAGAINRIEFLKKELQDIKASDVHDSLPILKELTELSVYVKDYFKESKLPV